MLPCIAVDSIDTVLQAVVAHGGEVVKPRTAIVEGADWEAIFRDPAGNAIGLYEEGRAGSSSDRRGGVKVLHR